MKYPDDFVNKIIWGDCLLEMQNIPDKCIDMILCDLPYGTTACKWDTIIPFEPLWEHYKRIIKDNGAIVLTASQPFTSALVMSNIKMFKYCWYWEKSKPSNFLNCKKQPMRKVEDVVVFYVQQSTYNPQGLTIGKQNSNSGVENTYGKVKKEWSQKVTYTNYPHNILKFSNVVGKQATHPTQKPVALFEYLIKTYTNEDDLVLDNCAGSGTTGVACKNLNRRYILIEKEEKYCKIAEKRLNNTQKGLF